MDSVRQVARRRELEKQRKAEEWRAIGSWILRRWRICLGVVGGIVVLIWLSILNSNHAEAERRAKSGPFGHGTEAAFDGQTVQCLAYFDTDQNSDEDIGIRAILEAKWAAQAFPSATQIWVRVDGNEHYTIVGGGDSNFMRTGEEDYDLKWVKFENTDDLRTLSEVDLLLKYSVSVVADIARRCSGNVNFTSRFDDSDEGQDGNGHLLAYIQSGKYTKNLGRESQ